MHADDEIAERAAAWVARRDRGLTAEEARAFAAWCAEDPRHAAELARIDQVWRLANHAEDSPALVRMACELESSPTRQRGGVNADARAHPISDLFSRRPAFWVGAMAAAAVVTVATLGVLRRSGSSANDNPASYRIVQANARVLNLTDGSVVDVKSGGELSTDYSREYRRVVLARGEAHFAVAKNPARPFIVTLGGVAVRAVGTAFDIRRQPSEVEVVVTEGKVVIDDTRGAGFPPTVPLLVAGQRAIISLDHSGQSAHVSIDTPAPTEVERQLAWRSTWLVFDRTTLASAVEAFNRHGTQQLVLGDESLRDRRLGGTFRTDNVDGFVRLLHESLDVKSERLPNGGIVLLSEH